MCGERSPPSLVDRKPHGILETVLETHVRLYAEVESGDLRVFELLELLLLRAELGLCATAFLCAEPLLFAFALLALSRLLARLALGRLLLLARLAFGFALRGKRLRPFLRRALLLGFRLLLSDLRGLCRRAVGLALLLPFVPADLGADCNCKKDDDESHVGNYGTNSRGALCFLRLAPRFFEIEPSADCPGQSPLCLLLDECQFL